MVTTETHIAPPAPAAPIGSWRQRVSALRQEMQAMADELAALRQKVLESSEPQPELLNLHVSASEAGLEVELDGARRELRFPGSGEAPIPVTVKEYELLQVLLGEPGRVFSRASLQHRIWGVDNAGQHRNVDAHISRLRHKMGHLGAHLDGLYGSGYRWATPELEVSESAKPPAEEAEAAAATGGKAWR